MKIIQGNILTSGKDIIVQQVNCRGFMGGGLAIQIIRFTVKPLNLFMEI